MCVSCFVPSHSAAHSGSISRWIRAVPRFHQLDLPDIQSGSLARNPMPPGQHSPCSCSCWAQEEWRSFSPPYLTPSPGAGMWDYKLSPLAQPERPERRRDRCSTEAHEGELAPHKLPLLPGTHWQQRDLCHMLRSRPARARGSHGDTCSKDTIS